MKTLAAIFSICVSSFSFASEGGDLLIANTGTNIREGNSLNAPVIRTAKADEVFYRLPGNPENGFVKIKLQDGSIAWIYDKYTYRLVDKDKSTVVNATTSTKG